MPKLLPLIDGDIALYSALTGAKGKRDFIQAIEAIDEFIDRIEQMFENKAKIFLTGKNNFRYQVATLQPYKGNRTSPKPRYFNAMREYLVEEYKAIISEGCEADDVIVSYHKDGGTVICSSDKDFKQRPGFLLNTYHNKLKEIGEYEADFEFYISTLIGDSADNIPGVSGIGKKKAPEKLADQSKEEMEQTCLDLYIKQYGPDKGPAAFEEVKTLLRLRTDCKDCVI